MDGDAIEMFPVPDIYADGIADVEVLGDGENIRITFFTWRHGEKVIVCRMVRPRASYLSTDMFRALIKSTKRRMTEGLQ